MDVAKAAEVVVDNNFYDEEDMRALADEVTEPVIQRIALYEAKTPTAMPSLGGGTEVKSIESKAEPEALEIDDDLEIITF